MRLGKAAQALGIDTKTVTNWIKHPALSRFFSDSAKGLNGLQKEVTETDLYTLNTVRILRAGMSNKEPNWNLIADQLATGYRDKNLPPQAATVDLGLSRLAQTERMLTITAERDKALERAAALEQTIAAREAQINALQHQQGELQERLLRELGELKAELATARTELDLWRSGRLRPE